MPFYKVTIPYTGTQTCLVDADSPEEALQKAKKEEFFREEIRLDWNNVLIGLQKTYLLPLKRNPFYEILHTQITTLCIAI
mgnify:CR=1 FL=1